MDDMARLSLRSVPNFLGKRQTFYALRKALASVCIEPMPSHALARKNDPGIATRPCVQDVSEENIVWLNPRTLS